MFIIILFPSLHSQLTRRSFGEVVTIPLIPGGASVPVTKDNLTEYVRAYVKYVLDESVKEPFLAFDEGFKRVCDGKVLVSSTHTHTHTHLNLRINIRLDSPS